MIGTTGSRLPLTIDN